MWVGFIKVFVLLGPGLMLSVTVRLRSNRWLCDKQARESGIPPSHPV